MWKRKQNRIYGQIISLISNIKDLNMNNSYCYTYLRQLCYGKEKKAKEKSIVLKMNVWRKVKEHIQPTKWNTQSSKELKEQRRVSIFKPFHIFAQGLSNHTMWTYINMCAASVLKGNTSAANFAVQFWAQIRNETTF